MNEKLACRIPAIGTLTLETAEVKVWRWEFAPGAETGFHRHGFGYVVVPVTDGVLRIEAADGSASEARLTQGVSYAREAGVEHNVVNAGEAPMCFVEIELKHRPG
jgi:beta-alanine degradation protein BauB